jgi:hypothetical protein
MRRRNQRGLHWPSFVDETPDDYFFEPTKGEREAEQRYKNRLYRLEYLAGLKAKWETEDIARLKRRAAELESVVAKDRAYVERVNQIQQENDRVTNWWLAEQKKTADAIHAAQLKKLELILEDIQKDNARAERAELLRRNVVGGRRSNVR